MSAPTMFPISPAELERRWTAVRAVMEERQIDALVMQGSNDWLGGYVKWFTDVPATNAYPRSVVFPRTGRMAVVEQGPFDAIRVVADDDPASRGVERILYCPSFASVAYTGTYDAELVARELAHRGVQTVGLVATSSMYHDFCARLRAESVFSFVDATDAVDRIKAIKSEEEIAVIRQTAALQDRVIAAVAAHLRPGLKDFEVAAYAQYAAQLGGSEQGIVLAGSAPPGRAATFRPRHAQGRELRPGDHLTLLLEVNGPGGLYTEIARTFVLGNPTQELLEATEAMVEAQDNTLKQLVPGASCPDVLASHNAFMRAAGLPEERRLHCHGQGYDLVERPLVRADEPMAIAPGMNLAVHPGFETERVWVTVCDNYLIGEDGPGDCLHATPKHVIEV